MWGVGSGDSNSDLHAFLAKDLHTEPLPSPWLYNLMKILFFFGMTIVTFLMVFLELKPLVEQMQNGALVLAFKSSIS